MSQTRTYNSLDTYARPFGAGMMYAYTLFKHSEHQFDEADLIEPDGAKIYYVRIFADGLPWYATVLESEAAPDAFYKSQISFNFTDDGWTLALKDGTVYILGTRRRCRRSATGTGTRSTCRGRVRISSGPAWATSRSSRRPM